jgi:putative IMPACT (imprinted ancient) family translation regulator
VLVVVVRYFGGVLLGTGGLIHAYRESTALALQNAVIIDKKPTTDFNIFFDYSILGELMEILKRLECPIIQKDFHSNPSLTICIPTYEADLILLTIKAHLYKVSMEEAAKLKDASGLKIIRLE